MSAVFVKIPQNPTFFGERKAKIDRHVENPLFAALWQGCVDKVQEKWYN